MRGLSCNCSQSGMNVGGHTRGLAAAPSWYDNLYNEVSSDAENLWNDVESAAVWADNTLLGPFSAQSAINAGQADAQQSGPLTQFSQGFTDAGPTLESEGQQAAQGVGNFFRGIANLGPEILLVGGGIMLLILLDKD